MKKILLVPAMAFPYALVGGFVVSLVFGDYALLAYISLFLILPIACNIAFCITAKNADPYELVKMALLVKLLHIPAYIAVFLFGAAASIMFIFTFPLILAAIIFDCITLFISSTISVFALAKNSKINKKLSLIALVCQFFFCADVISLLVLDHIQKSQAQPLFEQSEPKT